MRPVSRVGFPRLYAAASLKHPTSPTGPHPSGPGFPRLYAAASLKHPRRRLLRRRAERGFSAALCRGLIEAAWPCCWKRSAGSGFPRLYAAASLKPAVTGGSSLSRTGFPRLYAAASLKPHPVGGHELLAHGGFSAALCRGLIEARGPSSTCPTGSSWFSAALCRGLIEACRSRREAGTSGRRFSAALCRGLIEAAVHHAEPVPHLRGFPRLYAAASLKPTPPPDPDPPQAFRFSAALCRGLIEATGPGADG